MIDGLKIDVPSSELKEMLLARLKFHTEKLAFFEQQLIGFRKTTAALDEEAQRISKGSSADPISTIEQAVKKHRNQTIYYNFMAKHVIANETYRLDESDLVRLGVEADRYY